MIPIDRPGCRWRRSRAARAPSPFLGHMSMVPRVWGAEYVEDWCHWSAGGCGCEPMGAEADTADKQGGEGSAHVARGVVEDEDTEEDEESAEGDGENVAEGEGSVVGGEASAGTDAGKPEHAVTVEEGHVVSVIVLEGGLWRPALYEADAEGQILDHCATSLQAR